MVAASEEEQTCLETGVKIRTKVVPASTQLSCASELALTCHFNPVMLLFLFAVCACSSKCEVTVAYTITNTRS